MKFVTFSTADSPPLPGLLTGQGLLPLPFPDMLAVIQAGQPGLQEVEQHLERAGHADFTPLERAWLHAPLPRPVSLRDFYAFEAHVATAHANRGRQVPPAWYEIPVFYYSNHTAIYGPGDTIPYPHYSQALDYELEIACIIGAAGRDISPGEAGASIFGFTIFNDWSARDEQSRETRVGLGPAKGKDFASSFGPWIVTPDELQDRAAGRPGVYDLEMRARVNGELRSQGNFSSIYHATGDLIARASQAVMLNPGDILGSGTVGGGCLLELTGGEGPWLQPGDVVELEIERLGKLVNTVGPAAKAAIHPPGAHGQEVNNR